MIQEGKVLSIVIFMRKTFCLFNKGERHEWCGFISLLLGMTPNLSQAL